LKDLKQEARRKKKLLPKKQELKNLKNKMNPVRDLNLLILINGLIGYNVCIK
jgi:tmRNA-binding protein